ncbi:hypothetical protein COLO4_06530 [Corchorus olitorius]|uniref:Uncharacterized protein n=1 Tax=Corchorus olitorius TaxID=93759 RepID=A0A1R3KMU0_9ROSI|nr:hypothetical protein COLO4_06530 [Corchorus olitorius]
MEWCPEFSPVCREFAEPVVPSLKDKPKERMPSWLQSTNSPGILLSL